MKKTWFFLQLFLILESLKNLANSKDRIVNQSSYKSSSVGVIEVLQKEKPTDIFKEFCNNAMYHPKLSKTYTMPLVHQEPYSGKTVFNAIFKDAIDLTNEDFLENLGMLNYSFEISGKQIIVSHHAKIVLVANLAIENLASAITGGVKENIEYLRNFVNSGADIRTYDFLKDVSLFKKEVPEFSE